MLISLSLADIGTLPGVLAGLFGVSVGYALFLTRSERADHRQARGSLQGESG